MPLLAVEIPKVGLVMETARLVRWLKAVGDTVTTGEPLLEVETEKSIIEIPATVSGRLVEILLDVDQEAKVGDRIAVVKTEETQPARAATPTPQTRERADALPSSATLEPRGERIRSSPVARRLAAEQGVDLGRISGTGPRGRVQLEDVKRALETRTPVPHPSPQPSPRDSGEGTLSPMRRAVARAMTLSNATVPQFWVERSVDMSSLQKSRGALSATLAQGSPKLSVNDFLLQAVARTLREFPALNATFHGTADSPDARIVPASGAHIGLVVAIENGLLVPVLHHVERLGLAELARVRSDLVERALRGRLKREELEGATFSISNLGAQGPDRFNALINPPQSAILAVGRQRDRAVPGNGGIEVRPMCELTLTVDHRIGDGRLASEFLARIVEVLEGGEWRVE
ncbi:MAG TPA: dihydrolipoamide acetyltransferase family protein [Steroidobacteraceae bacterium]|nr:dihydrolipoamide acetyltransferase family protein [Steroidobacteraceae bacterium]